MVAAVRLAVTWTVDWMAAMRDLPRLVTYEIAPAGDSVKLDHDRGASMGRAGRPARRRPRRLAGDPLQPQERARNRQAAVEMEPPKEMMAALEKLKRG